MMIFMTRLLVLAALVLGSHATAQTINVRTLALRAGELPEIYLEQISHFFEHYKDLEPGKWVKIGDWKNAETARELITASIERAKASA